MYLGGLTNDERLLSCPAVLGELLCAFCVSDQYELSPMFIAREH